MSDSLRADLWLVAHGLAPSRARARQWIEAGRVRLHRGKTAQVLTKPSQPLSGDARVEVAPDAEDRFVSRGGLKLAGALAQCGIGVEGAIALDVGASTGGFSDCLLQAGARMVVAVDVGHGQLAPSLREHPRLICYEGVNARALPASLLRHAPGGFGLAVMDVSFISQTLILPALIPLLAPEGVLLSLVKPQFEVGRAGLGKGGIVRDPRRFEDVENRLRAACAELRLEVADYFESPLRGGDGNREFFLLARMPGAFSPPDRTG